MKKEDKKIKNPFLRVDLLYDKHIKELKKEIKGETNGRKKASKRNFLQRH